MVAELPATALPLKKMLEGLASKAEGPIKKQFNIYLANKNIKHIYDHLRGIGKIRTIWQTDRAAAIRNFYYPQKISADGQITTIKKLSDLTLLANRVVIQGIVGQGKSIFLRYLCVEELKSPGAIPVFLEIRKFTKDLSLIDEIKQFLADIGLDNTEGTFQYLAKKQKITLFLDAYDEAPGDLESQIFTEIERFCTKFPNLTVIVTSRPNHQIQNSGHFAIADLAPLEDDDLLPLLNKLCTDRESASEIHAGINRAGSVLNLLTTPLMVTLLVFVYKADKKIPSKPIEFYDSLFLTVLSRHDKSKPGGVTRKRKTSISDSSFRKVFDCISFLSSQELKTSFSNGQLVSYIDKAKNYYEEDVDSDDLLEEICQITCLILKEGFDYNYLHKSIQEYHAAEFISNLPESKAIEFYQSLLKPHSWGKWYQQIQFLLELDRYGCYKHFILPACDQAAEYMFGDGDILKESFLNEILSSTSVTFRCRDLKSNAIMDNWRIQSFAATALGIPNFEAFYPTKHSILRFTRKCTNFHVTKPLAVGFLGEPEDRFVDLTLGELVDMLDIREGYVKEVSEEIRADIERQRETANIEIQRIENTQDIFQF